MRLCGLYTHHYKCLGIYFNKIISNVRFCQLRFGSQILLKWKPASFREAEKAPLTFFYSLFTQKEALLLVSVSKTLQTECFSLLLPFCLSSHPPNFLLGSMFFFSMFTPLQQLAWPVSLCKVDFFSIMFKINRNLLD